MIFNKRAQSTAEYAILLGLVVAVAAGVLQVALKGGMRQKHSQAMRLLMDAGKDNLTTTADNATLFSEEFRQTTVKAADYADKAVLQKGGAEKRYQTQTTSTVSVSLEKINATQ